MYICTDTKNKRLVVRPSIALVVAVGSDTIAGLSDHYGHTPRWRPTVLSCDTLEKMTEY